MNILYIEDEEPMSSLYKDLFEKEGITVDVAPDGESGFEKAIQTHPDLILLDIILPRLNGKLVLTKLRNDPWGKTVPIIIFSNLDTDNSLLEGGNQISPTYFILKANVTPGDVLKKVKDVLSTKH
jgi:DNA-binding response OmpR family regulator